MAPRTTTTRRSDPTTRSSSTTRPARPPIPREVADMLGVTLSPPRRPEQTARLRKALPGVEGILDGVAALRAENAGTLHLKDVTPEAP
ncbi:hypothetical protein WME95_40890 [Sorangium sp. So ce327]|uniref:hypothetical protein n=1 Tax=Sorangium sp. So ce327 TaxID=3133301 RepID=UPI003F604805